MDIPRPENKRRKRIKQLVIGSVTAVVLLAITVGLSQLEPAAPSVDGDTLWIQPVTQGEMLRQVRGPGTLEARDMRWISARSAGRVERIVVRPGAAVEPDTIIVELSNPDLMRQAEEARYTLEAGKAQLTELELNLKNQQLDQRAAVATARAAYEGARLQAEAERASTTVAALTVRRSELLAEQLKTSLEVAQERLDQFAATMAAQVAARRAQLAGNQNAYERVLDQVVALEVRAGIAGVLQQVEVEEGGQVQLHRHGALRQHGLALGRGVRLRHARVHAARAGVRRLHRPGRPGVAISGRRPDARARRRPSRGPEGSPARTCGRAAPPSAGS